jgi:drug/metabolite transporter (DMT)-like permease
LANLTPIVVTAVAWFVFHQRPAPLFLLAVALSVVGSAVMALSRGIGVVGPNPLLGDALSAGTSIWYAMYFLALREARRRQSAAQVMFWSSLTGLPLVLLVAWLLNERIAPASVAGWAACVGLGVVHVGGQGSIAWAMGRLPPSTAAVTVFVQPIVTTVAGWLLFSELLSAWQAAGAALVLSGVVLAQRASQST